jgi:hypothetical protein
VLGPGTEGETRKLTLEETSKCQLIISQLMLMEPLECFKGRENGLPEMLGSLRDYYWSVTLGPNFERS